MEPLEDHAETLARRITALADPEMRVAYLRTMLLGMSPAVLADLVALVATRSASRHRAHGELSLALALALDDPRCDGLRQAAVQAAAERGHREAVLLLGRHTPDADDGAARVPDFGAGRPLTLGERKALARRNDRGLIARVLRDPHQDVIRVLLGNPALTEQDVVRLCARRPIAPDTLRQVFRSTRWVVRDAVRRALVLNPHTPLDVSLQLARLLNRQDVRRVARSREVSATLREACERHLGTVPTH